MFSPNNQNHQYFSQEKSPIGEIEIVPNSQLQQKKTTPKLVEPTIEWVLEFAYRIDIAPKYLNYISHQLGGSKAFWFEYLHEIAHYAVKDNSYIDHWWQHEKPGNVPNMNWSYLNGAIAYHPYPYYNPKDFTPDEHGVRAWALSALELNNWINPINSSDWGKYAARQRKNRTYVWTKSYIDSNSHPVCRNGFEQLKAVGIDFSRQDFRYLRPTVASKVGWQPTVGRCFNRGA